MAARLAGADPIIGIDRLPRRLQLALELGATHVIDNRHEDTAARVKAITGGGVDYALEITGSPAIYQLALDLVHPRGAIALIAAPGGANSLSRGRRLVNIIQGDAVPQTFIPKMIAWHQAGQFPFHRLITYYDFQDINQAIADAKQGDTIKPVLRISPV